MQSEPSYNPAAAASGAAPNRQSQVDITHTARVFNSAILSTKASRIRGDQAQASPTLRDVLASPGYQAILNAVRSHARAQGITEKVAAEELIETFRNLDALWFESVFMEGLGKLKNQT